MIQFILTDILMVSLGTIFYLVARSLPRIEEEPETKQNIFERWVSSDMPEKIDAAFNGFLLKSIRKLKLVLLKADNSLAHHLKKIAPNGNGKDGKEVSHFTGKPKIDFKDITVSDSGEAGAVGIEKNSESEDNQIS